MTLEEEAKLHYSPNWGGLNGATEYRAFIKGATSKYVQRQRIEAIIWTLEELRNIDTVKYIDPKIDELQEQLKKLEDGN